MNEKVIVFMKDEIKKGLALLNDDCVLLFKRMYSHNNLEASIDEAVENMPTDELDWALSQVERSLKNPKLIRLDMSGKHLC